MSKSEDNKNVFLQKKEKIIRTCNCFEIVRDNQLICCHLGDLALLRQGLLDQAWLAAAPIDSGLHAFQIPIFYILSSSH
jgi:hypothetical protein